MLCCAEDLIISLPPCWSSREVPNEHTDVVADATPNCLSSEFPAQCLSSYRSQQWNFWGVVIPKTISYKFETQKLAHATRRTKDVPHPCRQRKLSLVLKRSTGLSPRRMLRLPSFNERLRRFLFGRRSLCRCWCPYYRCCASWPLS